MKKQNKKPNMPIKYITDCQDAINEVEKYDVVMIATTTYSMLHGGFAMKMKNKFPIIQEINDRQPYADQRRLGKRLTLKIKDNGLLVSLLYCTHYPNSTRDYLDYEALEKCLITANKEFKGKKVMCDFLGATRFNGNGDKERCRSIIEKTITDIDLTVYDYEQLSYDEEIKKASVALKNFRKTNPERCKELGLTVDKMLVSMYVKHPESNLDRKTRGTVGAYKLRFDRDEFNRRMEVLKQRKNEEFMQKLNEKKAEDRAKAAERKRKREEKKKESNI